MDLDNFELQGMYNQMSLGKKISLFLKTNHFVIWKITLMDITILVPLFVAIGYAFDRCTGLGFAFSVFVSLFVCSVIEYFRIKLRRLKTCQYIAEKVEYSDRLFKQLSEAVERSGTEEDKLKLAETMKKLQVAKELVSQMTDIVFKEDVIGFSDDSSLD